MLNRPESTDDCISRLVKHADRAGRLALKSLFWMTLFLLAFQLLLRIGALRPFISPVYRMEGIPVDAYHVKDWKEKTKPSFLHHSS
ncbi:hypothetical protein XI25_21340 [Paenibacillus sp. DMB20]|nr:hypothetical protein XI25_21340 [Paenibacillus sp. DMB20]